MNPDAELSREALRRAWRIVKWKSGGSGASRDVMASASTAPAATPVAAPAAGEALQVTKAAVVVKKVIRRPVVRRPAARVVKKTIIRR